MSNKPEQPESPFSPMTLKVSPPQTSTSTSKPSLPSAQIPAKPFSQTASAPVLPSVQAKPTQPPALSQPNARAVSVPPANTPQTSPSMPTAKTVAAPSQPMLATFSETKHPTSEFSWGDNNIAIPSQENWQDGQGAGLPKYQQATESPQKRALVLGVTIGVSIIFLLGLIYLLFLRTPNTSQPTPEEIAVTSPVPASSQATKMETTQTTTPTPTPTPAQTPPTPIHKTPPVIATPNAKPTEAASVSFLVTSSPPGAEVSNDGNILGVTPFQLKSINKPRLLSFSKNGFVKSSRMVPADNTSVISITLKSETEAATPEETE